MSMPTESLTRILCAAVCMFGLVSITAAEPTALVLALKPDKNPEAMAAERQELGAALAVTLGRPVQVIVPLSDAVINEGLANGTIDCGWLSATDVAKLPEPRAAGVLLAAQVKGATTYRSVWLSLADKPYASIADLRGKPVAFAKKTSTSGCTVPLWDLGKQGLIAAGSSPEAFFGAGNCWYGTGYVSAVERVLSGTAEAAAVSDYVIEGDKHLTPEQKAKLKVIASQGPVPTHVLAVRTSLTVAERTALRTALIALGGSVPALRDRVFGGPLIEVDEAAHLAPISAALAFVKGLTL